MRNAAVAVLTLLAVPAVSAAVLPVGVVVGNGGTLRSVLSAPSTSAPRAPVDKSAALVYQSAPSVARGEWTADTYNTWRGDDGEPRIQFNLRTNDGDSRWGFGVRHRDLVGFPQSAFGNVANDIQFSWTREAGTFRFTGSFDEGRGSGTYTFTPDQSFISNMATAGYRNLATEDVVRLAVTDVTMAHVRGLTQIGYPNLTLDEIVRTRIHGVTPEFVRAMQQRGYKSVPVQDLVKMRIHKVTAEEVDQLRAAGFANLTIDDLVKFRIHKVTPAFISELKALGFTGMDREALVRFRIHKVTPEYIKQMRDVGFTAVSEDQLVRMRIHKVDAMFVRHAREDGLTIVTPADAVNLAIHGPRWKRRQ